MAASQYKEDKAKYDEEHPELSSKAAKAAKKRKSDGDDDGGGKGKGDGKAKKAKKDPNAPKRGQNAFSEPRLPRLSRDRRRLSRGWAAGRDSQRAGVHSRPSIKRGYRIFNSLEASVL